MTDTPTPFERSQHEPRDLAASIQSASPAVEAREREPSAATELPEVFTKVARAKQEWEATADCLPQLICLIDERGAIIRANRVVETWGLGSARSISGLHFHRLLHPRCSGHSCYLRNLLRDTSALTSSGHRSDLETFDSVLRRDVHVTLAPILDRAKTAQDTLVIIIEDISECKQAELRLRLDPARVETVHDLQEAPVALRKALDRVRAWL
jgi:PAS domain-containing protein